MKTFVLKNLAADDKTKHEKLPNMQSTKLLLLSGIFVINYLMSEDNLANDFVLDITNCLSKIEIWKNPHLNVDFTFHKHKGGNYHV